MNDRNLIPMNKRTPSEQREITRKGGIESGKARRRKKTLKDISKMFLNARAAIWAKVKDEIAAAEKEEPVKIIFDISDDGREPGIDHAND